MKSHHQIVRILAGLAFLIVAALVGGYFYLQSTGFQDFALRKIIEQTDQATGGRTQIRAFDFKLSTLTAHLYNVVIRGKEAPQDPPLLQIDQLTVQLKIQSLLHRKISFHELLVEHPVVHLQVDRSGKSNVPETPPPQSSGHTSVFDLAVGHVALTRGEIDYNDQKTPVEADAYDLGADVTFESLLSRYRGSISYSKGRVLYGKYAPWPHSFRAKFNATPTRFSLESATMRVAGSTVSLHADVTSYGNPTVVGQYNVLLHGEDLAAPSAPMKTRGDVFLAGNIHYQAENNRPALRSLVVQGVIGSEAFTAASPTAKLELRKLQGKYELANASFRTHGLQAQALGGQVSADIDVKNLDATPTSRVRAALRSISLQDAQQVVHSIEHASVRVSGLLDGTADAAWTGSPGNMHVRSDVSMRAATRNTSSTSATSIPVTGTIHALYDGPKNILTVHETTFRIPSTTLTAEGQVSKHSNLQIRAVSNDLHQLVALVSAFRAGTSPPPAVSGTATLSATVAGSIQEPQISSQVSAQNLRVQGSEWQTADVTLHADPSQIGVAKGTLVNAQKGRASFQATIGLHNWSYLPENPIQANLSVEQMPVTDLQRLANVQYPVLGELHANASLTGSQNEPRGTATVEMSNASAYGEPIQNLALKAHAENGSIVSTLNIATNAGSAASTLTYTPKTRAYQFHLDAPGIVLQKLRTVQAKNLDVTGTLTASANGQGTLDDPQFTATLQLPTLEVRQKSIAGLKADVHMANKRADLTVDSQVAQAAIRARGTINLAGDYETYASIDTTSIPLDVLLATYVSSVPEGFQGQTELHATLKGPLKDKTRLEAHLTIPTLNATYQALQIGAAGPIRADYAHSVVTVHPSELRGTGTSVHLQGSIPLGGTNAPNFTAQGSIDVRVVRILMPDVRSSGKVVLDIRTSGSAAQPQLQGQVHLQNVALATASAPLGVDKLNGTLDVGPERVQISNITGEVGGGQISAGGSVTYRPSLQFNVALQGNGVRLRYPEGLRTVLDTNLDFTGTMQASVLKGRVLIDGLSFTPDFDLASFGDQFSANVAAPAQPSITDSVTLQLSVQSKDNLSATSSQVSLEGSANLNVAGTLANPVITGRTDLTSGELFYRNVRYELQHGVITFDNPTETHPVMNVVVSTTVEQYNLTLNLRGPFDKLTTAYTADPPLPTADIINLIARGKTTAESAASSQSTDAMIASQAASQVSGNIQKLAGLSNLTIDPTLGGNNQNPSARIALQQRVTKNFLFTFSTDVSQPGNEVVQGSYQINKLWSVSVARDQLGGVSVNGKFHTKF
jgi:translocation and assembly module TamB